MSTCPWCGKANDLTSEVVEGGSAEPEPQPAVGDIVMCIGCGKFAVVTRRNTLRQPRKREEHEIARNKEARATWVAWRAMRKDAQARGEG